jgi:hypothetical protein
MQQRNNLTAKETQVREGTFLSSKEIGNVFTMGKKDKRRQDGSQSDEEGMVVPGGVTVKKNECGRNGNRSEERT